MRRRTTASALIAVGLAVGLAAGQPPAVPKAPADPTDALIQKALANDPDVQVARAKLALAEAEMAKARQATVARVLTLRDTIETHRTGVARVQEAYAVKEQAAKAGQVSREELLAAQDQLAAARAILAATEIQFRLLTGEGPKGAVAPRAGVGSVAEEIATLLASSDPNAVARALAEVYRMNDVRPLGGPIPDRIRAALDKKVRLGNKGDGISLDAAMEVFKREAGLDVAIRPTPSPMPRIVLDGEELPVGAWFQMFQDHGGHRDGFAFYVRDYGLLVANRQTAPPDAMTLTEFWRARPIAAPKQPPGKTHEFPHDKAPAVVKVKVGDVIGFTFPTKAEDVEEGKCGSDNPAVLVNLTARPGRAGVLVQAERAGKARVTWDVTDATGRRFTERGREVEFE